MIHGISTDRISKAMDISYYTVRDLKSGRSHRSKVPDPWQSETFDVYLESHAEQMEALRATTPNGGGDPELVKRMEEQERRLKELQVSKGPLTLNLTYHDTGTPDDADLIKDIGSPSQEVLRQGSLTFDEAKAILAQRFPNDSIRLTVLPVKGAAVVYCREAGANEPWTVETPSEAISQNGANQAQP